MKKSKNITTILVAACILVGVIVIVIIVGLTMPDHPDIIQGQADNTDYRMSCKVPTRGKELRVKEGDTVHRGDTLAILEAPDIQAKLSQAEAAYSAAEAMDQEAQNGTRQEQIQQAFDMLQKAKAGVVVAEKTYKRVNRLFESGVMAEQKRDEARAQYDAMVATEKAASAQYDMALNGARREEKAAAGAQVLRAKGAIKEVASYVSETVLIATTDGYVTEIFPEIGELVGTGAPIMNIASNSDVWFTFNVREDLLPGLKIGTETSVYVPAINKNVKVKITLMKEVGTFAAWKATKALDGFDLKTFEVQAHPIHQQDVDGVRCGMSAILKK